MSFFFSLIDVEEKQNMLIEYVKEKLETIINKHTGEMTNSERLHLAKVVFWNINFFAVVGLIHKTVNSLGSDKILEIVDSVVDKINSPAAFIVKHGILMWYKKNLRVDEISKKTKEKDFSRVGENVLKHIIVNHVSLHSIGYKQRQKLISVLDIPPGKLLQKPK
jgi:SNF family Na+-dependent transporter